MKRLLALSACLAMAACTTTNTKLATMPTTAGASATATAAAPAKPAGASKILIVQPDVQLALLTAGGLQETRADWSNQGRDNIAAELKHSLSGSNHPVRELDPNDAMSGKVGQLLRLNQAVGTSILSFSYGVVKLPTKKDGFDWTLGDGARALGEAQDADYALFVNGRGSYASGGRVAVMLLAAAGGVSVPLGGQTVFASLVDLKTGRVVWFNVARAGPSADIRTPEGAKELVGSLLKNAPL
jgi:hypothetical protein